MVEPTRADAVVTPEAVALSLDVAGLGSRMIAAMIDTAIQAALGIVVAFVLAGVSGLGPSDNLTLAVPFFVLLFLVVWGYYPLWEGLWNGRTPGKRAQRLRVVQADGQPVGLGPVLVRNLVRVVDFLPIGYGTGAITMLLTRRSQRLGDLAAGTVVVREHPAPAPAGLLLAPDPDRADVARRLDTTALAERDHEVVRAFLQRRSVLEPPARAALAHRLAEALRGRVTGAAVSGLADEAFLEAVVESYRGRFGPRDAGA